MNEWGAEGGVLFDVIFGVTVPICFPDISLCQLFKLIKNKAEMSLNTKKNYKQLQQHISDI